MTYKIKLAFLSALVAVLALIYILILVFDRDFSRSDVFAWLDPSLVAMADRIEITGSEGVIALNRRNNIWVFDAGNMELPVRQSRVEDLFSLLSRRALYPLRAASFEAMERLMLTENTAHRILIRGGTGLPLLDLLVGGGDILGREVYLRISGRNQIHSGEGDFYFFTAIRPQAWYDLNLFQPFSIDMIQQVEALPPSGEGFTLRRSGAGWIILGENAPVEPLGVDAWLRSIVEMQGEDFLPEPPESIEGSITLRLGDGTTRVLMAGPADEHGTRHVTVAGSSFVYSLSDWNIGRIFRERSHFIRD